MVKLQDCQVAVLSRQGQRGQNQDYAMVSELDDAVLVAVADGCGAHRGSEHAAKFSCEQIIKILSEDIAALANSPTQVMQAAAEKTQQGLREHLKELSFPDAATTLALLVVLNDKTCMLHVGDSRIYRYNHQNDSLWHTRDDNQFQIDLEKNLVTEADYDNNPGASILTKTMNGEGFEEPTIRIGHALEPHISFGLFSDGFWPYMPKGFFSDLADVEDKQQYLQQQMKTITQNGQDYDNMTAAIVCNLPNLNYNS